MKTTYRLTAYYRHFGERVGYFRSLDEIPLSLIDFSDVNEMYEYVQKIGTYLQIDVFTHPDNLHNSQAWADGVILNTLYFREVQQ